MSRVGKEPIPIPSGVEVTLGDGQVAVKGPRGELARSTPPPIAIARDGDTLVVGVSEGFSKELEIVGVGYRVLAQGPSRLELQVGFSHPVPFEAPDGITFEVPQPTRILVRGCDKQLVGQVAADIRKIRKPEPYKGKGIRYAGERVQRKAGKSAK